METVVILVSVAGLTAAGVWWWLSRSPAGRGTDGSEGEGSSMTPHQDVGGDFFVLPLSGAPPVREDRPPSTTSVARLALTLVVTTAILVGVAWVVGLLVKLQLDRYFRSGG